MGIDTENGRTFFSMPKIAMSDILKVIGAIVVVLGLWFKMDSAVAEIRSWGEPPAGRLYVLEVDVKHHHEVTTSQQEMERKEDHDSVLQLKGVVDQLSKQLEQQNKLQEQLLRLLQSKK